MFVTCRAQKREQLPSRTSTSAGDQARVIVLCQAHPFGVLRSPDREKWLPAPQLAAKVALTDSHIVDDIEMIVFPRGPLSVSLRNPLGTACRQPGTKKGRACPPSSRAARGRALFDALHHGLDLGLDDGVDTEVSARIVIQRSFVLRTRWGTVVIRSRSAVLVA